MTRLLTKQRRRSPLGALSTVLRASLLAALLATAAEAEEEGIPAVLVAKATVSDLRPLRVYSGRAVAVERIDVRARIEGTIIGVDFKEGAMVKAGDVLFRIDDRQFQAKVAEIKASLTGAQARHRLAELDRDRKAKLVRRGTISQADLDVANATFASTKSEVARLEALLTRAELELSFAVVTAPFDGIVGISQVDIGAVVGRGAEPLTTLTSTDPIAVEFPLTSAEIVELRETRLQQGGPRARTDKVTLTLPNGSAYETSGEIDFVGFRVSPSTDTSIVRAQFANPDQLILDGTLVGVTLIPKEPELVLSVPQRALQRDQLGEFLMVVGESGSVEQRRVVVERTTAGRVVIAEGLEEGEQVIVDGLTKVRPGIKVTATNAPRSG